jgi:hypothetical protein
MVTHFYDSSPDSLEIQNTRLKPARAIADENIPCLVWAEDALSFAHFVPTSLFALQLVVPDDFLDVSSSAIESKLPYRRVPGPHSAWLEFKFVDRNQPSCFPDSIHLEATTSRNLRSEDEPETIYIHPQSFFSFDVRNPALSVSLVPPLPSSNARLRFPNRIAFLNSLIDTLLDPPNGFRHWKLTQNLEVYIGYLITYTLRAYPRILPNDELEPEHAAVIAGLKEENQHYFESRIRRSSLGWLPEVKERRTILERAG